MKPLFARPAHDPDEERRIHWLSGARHAPADRILRARMATCSWAGMRVPAIAAEPACHPKTVRERLHRFNAEGLDGPGDLPIPGRPPGCARTNAPASSPWPARIRRAGQGATMRGNWKPPASPGRPSGPWTFSPRRPAPKASTCRPDLQEGCWRLSRKAALAGRSFTGPDQIETATVRAAAWLNTRAKRPAPPARTLRRRFVYLL
ncbi:helix-turn-helix domain-containing protein [Arthrobacter sp. GCM10027362]|uniref:helix-turn-helix domain-containing protein n=1 Tax=Arthrobacter sp. GCM10027362 TaxID=3273379 RepID=UPI003636169B